MNISPAVSRRSFLQTAALPMLARQSAHPNILVILSDDQGWGDLSGHGNPLIPTPNLDRFASQGIEFTRFHVSPVCAPTRASLLTGRYHLRCGVHGVTGGKETMRAEEVTLAEALRPAGYHTALLGKWHLGENYPYVPHAQGFDDFIGFRTGHWINYWDPQFEHNGRPYPLKGYVTEALTDEAIRYVDGQGGNPFFLYLAYNVPHSPFQVPERYWNRFRNTRGVSPETAAAYALTACLDDQVGRLLQHLDRRRLAENTIVLFLGDNGPNTDRYTGGLRGRKGSVYEGGTRSPLSIRWSGHFKGGRKVDRIAAHIDLFPTLLDLAGVTPPAGPKVDGRTLRPLLDHDHPDWPERRLYTHAEPGRNPVAMYPGAVRTQRYNLVNGTELYDVTVDPGEQTDIAARHPDKVAELKAAYEAWFADVMKPYGLHHFRIPVGYAEENPAVLTATQARLEGKVRYFQGSGWAHDWATNFRSPGDAMLWDLDVITADDYDVSFAHLCPPDCVGTTLSITSVTPHTARQEQKWGLSLRAGSTRRNSERVRGLSPVFAPATPLSLTLDVTLTTPTPTTPLPDRDVVPRKEAPEMRWAICQAGTLHLPQGHVTLAVRYWKGSGAPGFGVHTLSLRRRIPQV